MTVSVPGQLVYTYTGDGVTKAFSYPVRFLDKAEVVVILRDDDGDVIQTHGTHYSIGGSSWPSGGTITFVSAPLSTKTVVIYRKTAPTQNVDLENTQRNDANAVEDQLDRMVMVDQDLGTRIGFAEQDVSNLDGRVAVIEGKTDALDQAISDAQDARDAAQQAQSAAEQAQGGAEQAQSAAEQAQQAAEAAAASAEGIAADVIENYGVDWSAGLADDPEPLSVPQFLRRHIIDLDSFRTTDTDDFWPLLRSLLNNDNSIRDELISGARLYLRGGRAWNFTSRSGGYITLPQRLHWEMANGAFIDASSLPLSSAPNWFSYAGRYGTPTRPVNADYLKGTTRLTFGAGVVASRGWKKGDRLLIRATEQLTNFTGAYALNDNVDPEQPSSFTFWTPNTAVTAGQGLIGPNGFSYRVTADHTTPATFEPTIGSVETLPNMAITGSNALGEIVVIDGIQVDTIHLSSGLVYDYPEITKPILCRLDDGGEHVFENLNIVGNYQGQHSTGTWVTGRDYVVGDMVVPPNGSGTSGRQHVCLVSHTSGTFSTDLAAGRWADVGSDRVFAIYRSKKFHLLGGEVSDVSGYFGNFGGVEDFVARDHVGRPAANRASPGGYFGLSGHTMRGLLDNVTIHGGSQPIMMTGAAGIYGVTRGYTFRHCTVIGASSAFTQHNMSDDTTYDSCVVLGGQHVDSAGCGFDIRTPSRLINCQVRGLYTTDTGGYYGRAVLIRPGALGRFSGTKEGTEITGLKVESALSGIVVEDILTDGPQYYGTLTISNSRLLDIGGGGSRGAINAYYTKLDGGSPPDLGTISISNVEVQMNNATTAIGIAGRWNLDMSKVKVKGPGTGRSLLIDGGGNGATGTPRTIRVKNLSHSDSYAVPLLSNGTLTYAVLEWGVIGEDTSAIVPLTSNTTLDTRHYGKTFSNNGASGSITITLPGATQVYPQGFRFYISSAQSIVLQATSSNVFVLNGVGSSSANGTLTLSGTVGVWAEIVAVNSTNWVVQGSPSGLSVS